MARYYFNIYYLFCTHLQARTFIVSMPKFPRRDFSKFFVGANPEAVDILEKLLHMDPDKRPTATEALAHPYFVNFADPDDEVSQVMLWII